MAKIIMQGVKDFKWRDINVCASVGVGGVNRSEDVLVVQALMKYALPSRNYFRGIHFPVPNGIADQNLYSLIKKFQRYLRRRNTRVSVDGRIDPAVGLRVGNKRNLMWTIQQLNAEASDIYIHENGFEVEPNGYIEVLCEQYPQVDAILSGTAVGTLNLGLE